MIDEDNTPPATYRQAAGDLLEGWGGSTAPRRSPAPLEHQGLLDLVDEGKRARRERELADEQTKLDADLRAMVAPRYAAIMAEAERKAGRSAVTYISTFKRFFEDCSALDVPHLPSTPGVVAAYLESLRDAGATAVRLRREKASISYVHRSLEYADPTCDPLIEAICYDARQAEKQPKRAANGRH